MSFLTFRSGYVGSVSYHTSVIFLKPRNRDMIDLNSPANTASAFKKANLCKQKTQPLSKNTKSTVKSRSPLGFEGHLSFGRGFAVTGQVKKNLSKAILKTHFVIF